MIHKQWGSVSQTTNIFIIKVINLDRKCKHLFLAHTHTKKVDNASTKAYMVMNEGGGWVRKRNRGLTLQQATRAHTLAKPWRGAVGEEPPPEGPCTWDDAEALAAGSSYTSQPNNHRDSSGWEREVKMRHVSTDERTAGTWRWNGHAWTNGNLFAKY